MKENYSCECGQPATQDFLCDDCQEEMTLVYGDPYPEEIVCQLLGDEDVIDKKIS